MLLQPPDIQPRGAVGAPSSTCCCSWSFSHSALRLFCWTFYSKHFYYSALCRLLHRSADVFSSGQRLGSRGRILVRNPDKHLQSFPPCYSQSFLQLCLGISIFFKLTQPLIVSWVQLLHTVKEKGGKILIENHPYGLASPYRNLKSENSWEYVHVQKSQRNCTFINSTSGFRLIFIRSMLCWL